MILLSPNLELVIELFDDDCSGQGLMLLLLKTFEDLIQELLQSLAASTNIHHEPHAMYDTRKETLNF